MGWKILGKKKNNKSFQKIGIILSDNKPTRTQIDKLIRKMGKGKPNEYIAIKGIPQPRNTIKIKIRRR